MDPGTRQALRQAWRRDGVAGGGGRVWPRRAWPAAAHAALSLPDPQKGEKLILLTEQPDATRQRLLEQAREEGISEINVPRSLFRVSKIPLLGSGKD